MTHLIAVTNQKGGVGKTTTCVTLAACLAVGGKRTLLVDMDPQGNATSGLGIDRKSLSASVYELLLDSTRPGDVIQHTSIPRLDVLPASIELVGAEMDLVDFSDRPYRLANALKDSLSDYDYVLVDSPPSLGLLTVNVLSFVKHVLIPVQAEYYALEGLSMLVSTIEKIRHTLNRDLSILGLAMTMYDGRTNLAQQVQEEVRRVFGEKVFQTVINRSVRFSEASSFGKPIIFYDFGSKGAADYLALSQEVLDVCEKESARARA